MLKKTKANLIIVITAHNTHFEIAMQSLRSGRHVICEKPMAITTTRCDKMIAEAKKRNLFLTAYHNRHWDGSIVRALKIVNAGKIGEVIRVEAHLGQWEKPGNWWRSSKSVSGGILMIWAPICSTIVSR